MEGNRIKYPVGIQTFSEIIGDGFVYVDKTQYILRLLHTGKYIFLSRPRRFGKSLLLSMLHSFFSGERHLFQGLAVDSMDVEWKKRPVLHFDFNAENYTVEKGLEYVLDRSLRMFEEEYGIVDKEESYSGRFISLIRKIYETTGEKVVILIDEYDKPLLGIEDYEDIFLKNQSILKGFFGVLKSMDKYIGFAMLTGVARFNKVSIFSDLNNLNDISLDDEFAEICGLTQEELIHYFKEGISALAQSHGISEEDALRKMKDYYDGYLFAAEGRHVYNPFSVLNAFLKRKLRYFWSRTGTPTFLAKRVKKARISLPSLNRCFAYEDELSAIGVEDRNPIPILFQTGYLTIKNAEGDIYELKFPNKEVEIGFARYLQPLYVPSLGELSGEFSVMNFQKELLEGMPQQFMTRIQAMIKGIPYENHDEQLYQNVVYLLFTLMGADARLEEHTNIGRPDIVVRTERFVYIFEFKYNGSASEAMSQIKERDYAGRFGCDGRRVYMVGANFSRNVRGLEDWEIESF